MSLNHPIKAIFKILSDSTGRHRKILLLPMWGFSLDSLLFLGIPFVILVHFTAIFKLFEIYFRVILKQFGDRSSSHFYFRLFYEKFPKFLNSLAENKSRSRNFFYQLISQILFQRFPIVCDSLEVFPDSPKNNLFSEIIKTICIFFLDYQEIIIIN